MLSSGKSQIIVLHLTKYGDSGVIVHCIDSSYGRSGVLLRGLGKSRTNINHFHPLSILDIVSDSSSKSQLRYMKEYELSYRLDSIKGDLYKRTIAMFISEILYRSLHDNVGDEKLFDWLVTSIRMLNETDGSVSNYHLWWLVGFCNILGFKPLVFESKSVCENDATGMFIFNETERRIVTQIMESPFENVMSLPMTGSLRSDFANSMLKYLSFHLATDISSKSLPVLHDVMR